MMPAKTDMLISRTYTSIKHWDSSKLSDIQMGTKRQEARIKNG
jgi:hypothetical protein